jgi:hypothetical protein
MNSLTPELLNSFHQHHLPNYLGLTADRRLLTTHSPLLSPGPADRGAFSAPEMSLGRRSLASNRPRIEMVTGPITDSLLSSLTKSQKERGVSSKND